MVTSSADDGRSGVRRRLLAGVVAAVGTDGYRAVAVADVLAASGCARRTFYAHFADLEASLHEAHRSTTDEVAELATEAWVSGSSAGLEEGLEAVVRRLAALAAEQPVVARFWLLEAPAAGGPAIWSQQQRFVERLAAFARPVIARTADDAGREATVLAELFAGAVMAALRERLARGDDAGLDRLPADAVRLLASLAPAAGAVAVAA